jgi:hypothetical protein
MSSVKGFKLVTGEELIAAVDDKTYELLADTPRDARDVVSYTLRRPHVMQIHQHAPGKFGMAMVPYTLSNPDLETVTISAANVIISFPIAAEVEKQYLQQTSGLAIAGANEPAFKV